MSRNNINAMYNSVKTPKTTTQPLRKLQTELLNKASKEPPSRNSKVSPQASRIMEQKTLSNKIMLTLNNNTTNQKSRSNHASSQGRQQDEIQKQKSKKVQINSKSKAGNRSNNVNLNNYQSEKNNLNPSNKVIGLSQVKSQAILTPQNTKLDKRVIDQNDFTLKQRLTQQLKRGRYQPSQQHTLISAPQLLLQPLLNISYEQQQQEEIGNNAIHDKKQILFDMNQDEVDSSNNFEFEKFHEFQILSPHQLKDESSMSLNSQSFKNDFFSNSNFQSMISNIQTNEVQIGISSLRNMIKQKSVKDLKLALLLSNNEQQAQQQNHPQFFNAAISEIQENMSQIEESQSSQKQQSIIVKKSMSFMSSNLESSNHEDEKPIIHSQSCKKIDMMKQGSQFESPSERTIMDVLNLCSSTSQKYQSNQPKDSSFKLCVNKVSDFKEHPMILQQIEDDDDASQQQLRIGSNWNNAHDNDCSKSIIFNYGCGGPGQSDIVSVSSNIIVNNFLEEKKKELEALEEMDRESDTTEQMTYCMNSRPESEVSNFDVETLTIVKKPSKIFIYQNHCEEIKKRKKKLVNSDDGNEGHQSGSNLHMLSIRDLLDNQQQIDLFSTPDDVHRLNKIDASSLLFNNRLISQPKFKQSREQSTEDGLRNAKQGGLIMHSTSTHSLFQTQYNLRQNAIRQQQNIQILGPQEVLCKSLSKHEYDNSQENERNRKMFSLKMKSRNTNLTTNNNSGIMMRNEGCRNQYATLQNSRTTQNLIIDRTKNYFLKDKKDPLNFEILQKSPEDISLTDIEQNYVNINPRKAGAIKTFNYRPSKKLY